MIARLKGGASLPLLCLAAFMGAVCICLIATPSVPGGSPAASEPVAVFPIPGSRVAAPGTQITFRGIPASMIGTVSVTGSRSGVHGGTIQGDSDGLGGSFLPSAPFVPGEVVTVRTGLMIEGAPGGEFQFTVATPVASFNLLHWPAAPRVSGDVSRFHSRPDLVPAAVRTRTLGRTVPGDVFLAPQAGPLQDGPEIVDSSGSLVWFQPLTGDDSASDFRVQSYHGRPVLTWWQGDVSGGIGVGEDVIYNSSYQQIATVKAGNGLSADLHEFQLTPQGTALITAEYPVRWDLSSVHGPKNGIAFDSVVQEIDIPTGLVLFQWDSLDHVPVSSSYEALPENQVIPYDYFHVNSVDLDQDGTLLISSRNTSAVYKVDHQTGAVIWTLGGRRSTFRMGPGASFAFQHDVRVRSGNDWFITMFDDGAGPPQVHAQSRGLKLFLDVKHKLARDVGQEEHSPPLLASFEGNYQQLSPDHDFIGWGQQPYFTEYNSHAQMVFDGHFVDDNDSYRAYLFPWTGTPTSPPAVAASRRGSKITVYASWNGATQVASWRVLGGATPTALAPLATSRRHGFETSITTTRKPYVAVQALDSHGNALATSAAVPG